MKHVKFNLRIWFIPLYLYAFIPLIHPQTASEGNYVLIKPTDTPEQIIEKAANVTPSRGQYEWQKMEFTAFVHFGINTFDNLEWGKKNMDI
ncbi:MAG: hypothetical protein WBV81_20255, partial [Ignavibacteriaceae bacterium]